MTSKFDYLVSQLNQKMTSMRFNAARALGELGDERAIDALLDAFENDRSPAVKDAARIALLELGIDPEVTV